MYFRVPPSHIQRQRPIQGVVEVDPLTHNRQFHGLGIAGRVLRFEFRRVSKSALDRLDKLYQHRYTAICTNSYTSVLEILYVEVIALKILADSYICSSLPVFGLLSFL